MNDATNKFDMNLKHFIYDRHLGPHGHPDVKLYRAADGSGECRLGHYLIDAEVLERTYIGAVLTDPWGELGTIIGVEPRLGYWIVTQNEKVDIFRGQSGIRPVVLAP